MSTLPELRKMKDLFSSKKQLFDKSAIGVRQAIETIENNNQWKTINYQELSQYLTQMSLGNLGFDAESILNFENQSK